jgi:hypothetical protein
MRFTAGLKADLIQMVEHARSAVEAWMAGLSEAERVALPGPEGWAAMATLAHIGHWNRALLTSFELRAQGAAVPWQWEDMDGQNARLLDQSGSRDWAEVADEAARAYAGVRSWLERLSEEELRGPDDFAWQNAGPLWQTFTGNAYFHPLIHLAEYYAASGQPDAAAALRAEMDEANATWPYA